MTDAERELQAVIAAVIGFEPGPELTAQAQTDFYAAGLLDSLDVVEMVMMIEERLDIEIADEDLVDLRTYAQAVAAVEKAVQNRK